MISALNIAGAAGANALREEFLEQPADARPYVPASSGIPGWVAPAAIGTGALALVVLLAKKKRSR